MTYLCRLTAVGVFCLPLLACDSEDLACGAGTVRVGDVCIVESAPDAGRVDASTASGAVDGGLDSSIESDADVTGPTAMGVTDRDAGLAPVADASQPDASMTAATSDASTTPVASDGKHKLLVSDDGVALVQTANTRALTKSVRVIDNLGLGTPWTAKADQTWLTLQATATPGELSLTADPTGLPLDTVHYAKVTLSSTDPSVVETESVRVGFWISNSMDVKSVDIDLKEPAAKGLATDPIRPLVYVHTGGPDLIVYNVHTGKMVQTLKDVAPQIGVMTPSSDGSWLYVADRTNLTIVPVNLDDGTTRAPWVLGARLDGTAYTRSNGKKLLVTSAAGVRDALTGDKLAETSEEGAVAASQDGSRFCIVNLGLSPYTFYCHTLAFSDQEGLKVGPARSNDAFGDHSGSNGQDIALSPDGSRIYVASGAPYEFNVFAADTFRVVQVLAGEAYPTNVDVLEDGRILAGANSAYDPVDAWLYDTRGALKNTYRFGGYTGSLSANTLKASGDATRVVGITDEFSRPENPTMHIRALEP